MKTEVGGATVVDRGPEGNANGNAPFSLTGKTTPSKEIKPCSIYRTASGLRHQVRYLLLACIYDEKYFIAYFKTKTTKYRSINNKEILE